MAVALLTTTFSTLSTLMGLTMAAGTAIQFTQRSVSGANERINSRHSLALLQRANNIADVMCHIDQNVTASTIGTRMIQTLVNAINWALKYNRKRKIKKIFKFEKYRHIFECYHDSIGRELADLTNILALGKYQEQEEGYQGVPEILMHAPGALRSTLAANGTTKKAYPGKSNDPILQKPEQARDVTLSVEDLEMEYPVVVKQIVLPTKGHVHTVDISAGLPAGDLD